MESESDATLKTIYLKFLTREETADVKKNNFRCIRDVQEWATKKYQIHFWNQKLLFNGKVLKNDYKNLFDLFRENPNDSGTLTFQVLAAKTPFKVKVLETNESKFVELEVTEDNRVLQVKEKLARVKPDFPISYMVLCDYADPYTPLEDDRTLESLGVEPRHRLELRKIIKFEITVQNKAENTIARASFTFPVSYRDSRTIDDVMKKEIFVSMKLPKKTKYYLDLERGIRGSDRISKNDTDLSTALYLYRAGELPYILKIP
eukprot:TCONS_00007233-protein